MNIKVLSGDEKKAVINKLNEENTINFALLYFNYLDKEERKILIKKASNKLFSFLCYMKNNLDEKEVSYIIDILIDKNDFDSIMNIIKNFNYLLNKEDINNIVEFYLNKNNNPWDLVNLIKLLKFQLSENNISNIINKLCDSNCISVLVCILKDFNNIIGYNDIINIINASFKIDTTYETISEILYLVDFNLLSNDDIKLIIDKICLSNNESCISDSLINIVNKLNMEQVNYLVSKLDETNNLSIRVSTILLTTCIINNISASIIVKSVCKIGCDRDIIFIAKKLINIVDEDDIDKMVNTICSKKSTCSIVEISKMLKVYLSDNNIKLCANTLCEIKNIKFLYEFLCEFNSKLDEELKNKIKNIILNSREYKYIILLAVLVDISLINMLFEKIDDLYIFVIASGLFTVEEINLIKEKLNVKEVEPNVDKAIKSLKNINTK